MGEKQHPSREIRFALRKKKRNGNSKTGDIGALFATTQRTTRMKKKEKRPNDFIKPGKRGERLGKNATPCKGRKLGRIIRTKKIRPQGIVRRETTHHSISEVGPEEGADGEEMPLWRVLKALGKEQEGV